MMSRGMSRVLDCEEERVGLFAVWKEKGRQQRLIVDARRANARFRQPPGCRLLSSEGFAACEVDLGDTAGMDEDEVERLLSLTQVFVGEADVKDCFHRMRVPLWMSRYFALPGVTAKCLGLVGSELGGRILQA